MAGHLGVFLPSVVAASVSCSRVEYWQDTRVCAPFSSGSTSLLQQCGMLTGHAVVCTSLLQQCGVGRTRCALPSVVAVPVSCSGVE
ncbi:hypothetical protein E2C01_060894 [Portunus trituberculatus]|uniref:Secreted protein n=1 Tax=Portunus trituberculatus TaxID=210409 RepID=A0A5B7H9C0_PORTR|nr:hypothetical protein [Portunus trituberculatus]